MLYPVGVPGLAFAGVECVYRSLVTAGRGVKYMPGTCEIFVQKPTGLGEENCDFSNEEF